MKSAVVIAVLLCGTGVATAQDGAPAKPTKSSHGAPRSLPVVIPQQFAPPQEAYASFPESAAATGAATPSACQVRLGKLATYQPLPILVGPGDCGAVDAVQMDAIILPDQTKVAVTPPATLRCPMAEAVATWVREDVVPTLKTLAAAARRSTISIPILPRPQQCARPRS